METLILLAVSPAGKYRHLQVWAETLEDCLENLTELVRSGWQIIFVELVQETHAIPLPVEAFDGQQLYRPLLQLRKEWEMILA